MKRYVLMAMLVTGLAVAGRVVAQDNDNDRKSFKEKMEELEIQNKEMDLQERQAELDFRQECRKLEIEKKRTELNKQQQMIKMQMIPPGGMHMGMPGKPPRIAGPDAPGGMPPGGPRMEGSDASGGRPGCPLMGGQSLQTGKPPCHSRHCIAILLIIIIVHILLSVWVYQDIRKKNTGSGIWIVLVLMTGLISALVYAVVRIGDARQT